MAFVAEQLTVWLNVEAATGKKHTQKRELVLKFGNKNILQNESNELVIKTLTHLPFTAFIAPKRSFSSLTVIL